MYDPSIGRWLEEDPIGFNAGDPNLYRYVGNNSPNATDPSGQYIFFQDPATANSWLANFNGRYIGINAQATSLGVGGYSVMTANANAANIITSSPLYGGEKAFGGSGQDSWDTNTINSLRSSTFHLWAGYPQALFETPAQSASRFEDGYVPQSAIEAASRIVSAGIVPPPGLSLSGAASDSRGGYAAGLWNGLVNTGRNLIITAISEPYMLIPFVSRIRGGYRDFRDARGQLSLGFFDSLSYATRRNAPFVSAGATLSEAWTGESNVPGVNNRLTGFQRGERTTQGIVDFIASIFEVKITSNLFGRAPIRPRPPANLAEQLAMQEAQAGAGQVIMRPPFGDALFQAPGWVKIQHLHRLPNGTNIVVHYMQNTITGATTQFKFK